ncbi:MAG: YkgJ family cysteine cluster protein [Magnetococcus sp. WYHC-3]
MADPKSQTDYDPQHEVACAIPKLPMEVRNVIHPVRMSADSTFQFRCHPGIACFNECCRNIEIILTPYDMIRLRQRLNLSAEDFLYRYADPTFLQKGQLPVAIIAMDQETGRCPFNTDAGCSVYEDRPVNCRYYPIGLALMRQEDKSRYEDFYFLIKEPYCQGHQEATPWTVAQWRQDQGTDGYDTHNAGWMEVVLKRRSAGDMVSTSPKLSEMFYMASTNPAEFRRFVFDSTFLERYSVPDTVRERILHDDVALTRFAFDWMKNFMFGDRFAPVRPEAMAEVRERLLEKHRQRKAEMEQKVAREQENYLAEQAAQRNAPLEWDDDIPTESQP